MTPQATLFLIVGLPGAGKTTRARELEKAHRALRFSPDEWMIPLFGESDADGKRDLLEGLLINAGLCALAVGTNVVLDIGLWGRDERSALRSLGASVGAGVEVVYLPVDEATQLQRVQERFLVSPGHTIPITDSDQHRQVPRPTWLRPQRPSPTTNPCYLGRHNGVCAPLREFIGALPGASLREMPRSGQKSFAFGAGGAQMWMEEKLGTCIHTNRTEEALTKGASRIAVSCHFCHIMLSDGLTQRRSETSAHEGRGRRRGLYTSR